MEHAHVLDATLVAQALHGDRDAFGSLVTRYFNPAYAVALAHLGRHEAAQDAVQEAFLNAYRRLNTLRDPGHFREWLITIVRNACYSLRRKEPRNVPLEAIPEPAQFPDLERQDLYALIRARISELDPLPREALMLYYFSGQSQAQIAELLGISHEAAQKRVLRAREALGQRLVEEVDRAFGLNPEERKKREQRALAAVMAAPVPWHTTNAAAVASASLSGTNTLYLLSGLVAVLLIGAGMLAWNIYIPIPSPSLSDVPGGIKTPQSIRPAPATVPPSGTPGTLTAVEEPVPVEVQASIAPDGGRIQGIVFDLSGEPAAGAKIVVRTADPLREAPATVYEAVTDDRGAFQISNVEHEYYGVVATTETGAAFGHAGVTAECPSLFVRMTAVDAGSISGTVVDAAGNPISDALVEGSYHDHDQVSSTVERVLSTTRTDANGAFEVPLLPASKWQFYVQKDGTGAVLSDAIPVNTRDARIVLEPGHELNGRLVARDTGAPISGVVVQVRAKGRSIHKATVTSDAGGNFIIGGIGSGTHVVSLKDDQWSLAEGFQEVEMPLSGGAVDFKCVPTSAIAGQVLEAATNTPIEGVEAILYANSNEHPLVRSYPSDAEGRFFIAGLPPITHRFHIAYPGDRFGLPVRINAITLTSAEITHVTLTFPNVVRVTGTVVDSEARPVDGAMVLVDTRYGQSLGASVSADANGRFKLTRTNPGDRLQLVAECIVGRSEPVMVEIPRTGHVEAELVLEPWANGLIAGKIVDARGLLLQLRVHAQRKGDDSSVESWNADSKADGTFLLPGLQPGRYELGLGQSTGLNRTELIAKTVELGPGQKLYGVQLVHSAQSDTVIEGTVVDPESNPVADAHVYADPSFYSGSSPTGVDGKFVVTDLKPGVEYRMRVHHEDYDSPPRVTAIAGTQDLLLMVQPKPSVSGRILSTSGDPVKRFQIGMVGETDIFSLLKEFESSDGSFELLLSRRINDFVVRAENYRETHVEFERLEPGERLDALDIRMEPGTFRIKGHVFGTGGDVANVCVRFGERHPSEHSPTCDCVTDESGVFDMAAPSEEPVLITISHPEYATETLLVTPSNTVREFKLEDGGTVVVHAQPVESDMPVSIILRAMEQRLAYQELIGANGVTTFENVLPGLYEVYVWVQGERRHEAGTGPTCEVQNGRTTGIDVRSSE